MTETNKLKAALAAARHRVAGKTFAEAPEAFKDIESMKVQLRHADGKYQWLARTGKR